MEPFQNRRGRSSPFDFDRLISAKPEIKQAANGAEIAASVGELVRRVRTARDMTQSTLALNIGSTQGHISELERGLGPNGPTVETLARIVSELGDEVLIETAKERAAREAARINEVQSWALALLSDAMKESITPLGTSRVQALANAVQKGIAESVDDKTDSLKQVFAQGLLVAIRLMDHIEKIAGSRDVVIGVNEGRDIFAETVWGWKTERPAHQRGQSPQNTNKNKNY